MNNKTESRILNVGRDLTSKSAARPGLVRRLGLFDATMMVMGGIVGAGIFVNPHVVARVVHTQALATGAWLAGGVIALLGAFIYAELSARFPWVGGQYAYLREAYHPAVAFLYGWVLLLVIQTGGMAAVAVTFARYFMDLTGLHAQDWVIGSLALGLLTFVNCLGVRPGSTLQNILMISKIAAISMIILAGTLLVRGSHFSIHPLTSNSGAFDLASSFASAMVPVLFAYSGWHLAGFVNAELNHPEKDMSRALVMGVAGVIALYTGIAVVCVRTLGIDGLANSTTPASAVMRLALGQTGVTLAALAISVSALGFLSQCILTAPRVYYAMAEDRVFFRIMGTVNSRTHAPVLAIVLQSVWAVIIAFSGRYEQILSYVVSMDFLFYGLTALSLFIFRFRQRRITNQGESRESAASFLMPGHPVTTGAFILVSWLVVINSIYRYPANSLAGMAVLLIGGAVYFVWRRCSSQTPVLNG